MLGAIGSTALAHSNYYQIMIDGKLVDLCQIIESQSGLRGSFELLLIVTSAELVRPVSMNEANHVRR
jgi:hypothetical protein